MRGGVVPDAVQNMMKTIPLDPAEGIMNVFGNVPKKKTIHVLVKLPDATTTTLAGPTPVPVPAAPAVNFESREDLLAFLESEMTEKDTILADPHILYEGSLQFRSVGRERWLEKNQSASMV
ncbi:hypothetical protein V7S43_011237 [Phytophthora oleae]|uniref:Uncharacterized protein n=1 Tax=Phytophthora oleae TaxID=2107226 RepID=A0ABD3FC05_9STRA